MRRRTKPSISSAIRSFQALTARRSRHISKQRERNFCVGDLEFYPDRIHGRSAPPTHWENELSARLVAEEEHDGKKKESLRKVLISDGDVRSAVPLSAISAAADSGRSSRHYAKEKVLARYYQGEN